MLTLDAPAKLNLFLHITARRSDGYHNLQTLFQLIELCDKLHFSLRHDNQITISPAIEGLPATDNLIYQAAKQLQTLAIAQGKFSDSQPHGVSISIEKQIPMGGGLGGGSSNAATTLIALNQLWGLDLSKQTLAKLGVKLGADVPIFVHEHSAWAEGVGEIQTPVKIVPCYYLIITPPCHASTPALFAHPELNRTSEILTTPSPNETIDPFETIQVYQNAFEPVARAMFPEVDATLQWLNQFGQASLTGTGSSCFVPFHSASSAETAYQKSLSWLDQQATAPTQSGKDSPEGKKATFRCFLTRAKK